MIARAYFDGVEVRKSGAFRVAVTLSNREFYPGLNGIDPHPPRLLDHRC